MKKIVSLILGFAMMFAGNPAIHAASPKYLPFSQVDGFREGLAPFDIVSGSNYSMGFIDYSGKVIIPAQKNRTVGHFSEGLAAFEIGHPYAKVGFMDKNGKDVIEPIYERVSDFNEGLAAVRVNNRWGYIDKKGQEVLKPAYLHANDFREGLAAVQRNVFVKWGYIDKTGKEVTEPIYVYAADFSEGLAAVSLDGKKFGFIDKTGAEVIPPLFDYAASFSDGLASVRVDGKYGFIDRTGNIVIEPQYDGVHSFSEGLAAAILDRTPEFIFWGFIDKTGKVRIQPKYVRIRYGFNEGLVYATRVGANGHLIDGYVDQSGKELIGFDERRPAFWGAPFSDGYTVVTDGGQHQFYIVKNPLKQGVPSVKTEIPESKGIPATPTISKIMVDDKEVSFESYNINYSNYFKLRDLAMAVNGTEKSFEVGWDGNNNAINLILGKSYTPNGEEGKFSGKASVQNAVLSASKLFVDGQAVQLTAYTIDGYTYFKLRDFGETMGLEIGWDEQNDMIVISTRADGTN